MHGDANIKTTTDQNGAFTLGLLAYPDTLVFSGEGYVEEEVVVREPGTISPSSKGSD